MPLADLVHPSIVSGGPGRIRHWFGLFAPSHRYRRTPREPSTGIAEVAGRNRRMPLLRWNFYRTIAKGANQLARNRSGTGDGVSQEDVARRPR